VHILPKRYRPARVYVLTTSVPGYTSGPLSVWNNADAVKQELDAVDLIRVDTTNEAQIAEALMRIYEREGHPATVFVDITSTTKTLIKVVLAFSVLFCFRPYHVLAKKSYTNMERARRILDRLFSENRPELAAIKKCMEKYPRAPARAIKELRSLLEEKISKIGYDLRAESPGVDVAIAELPHLKRTELKDVERRALVKLLELRGTADSIKDLAEAIEISKKSQQLSFGYRVDKLESHALVSTETRGKQKRITLTSIGTGIAGALSRKRMR
jgi:hypothetical protein